jgi:hypothetical protein
MQAELSIELGAEDPTLAVPWSDPDSELKYQDLRQNPAAIADVQESRFSEMHDFLLAVNSPPCPLQSAKSEVWFSEEITEEEAVFGASCKFASYVDVFFHLASPRRSFPMHEAFGERLVDLLKRAPELQASFEAIIRAAHYESDGKLEEGLYFTLYVHGYGDDEQEARQAWGIALRLVKNAILQISSV